MQSNKYVAMEIIFRRTKNFKNAKNDQAFHNVIQSAIDGLKSIEGGPIRDKIRIARCPINYSHTSKQEFKFTLTLRIKEVNDETVQLIYSLRREIQKSFHRWGKYKVKLQTPYLMKDLDER